MNYHCECCDYHTSNKKDYNKHKLTLKHKNFIENSKIVEKSHLKHHCELCDFHTSNKNDYNRHCNTAKHKKTHKTQIHPHIEPVIESSIKVNKF